MEPAKRVTTGALLSTSAPAGSATLRDTLGLPHVANLSGSLSGGSDGVGVAIIDSGIALSAYFAGRITGFYDYIKGNGRSARAYDDFGHGTARRN